MLSPFNTTSMGKTEVKLFLHTLDGSFLSNISMLSALKIGEIWIARRIKKWYQYHFLAIVVKYFSFMTGYTRSWSWCYIEDDRIETFYILIITVTRHIHKNIQHNNSSNYSNCSKLFHVNIDNTLELSSIIVACFESTCEILQNQQNIKCFEICA